MYLTSLGALELVESESSWWLVVRIVGNVSPITEWRKQFGLPALQHQPHMTLLKGDSESASTHLKQLLSQEEVATRLGHHLRQVGTFSTSGRRFE